MSASSLATDRRTLLAAAIGSPLAYLGLRSASPGGPPAAAPVPTDPPDCLSVAHTGRARVAIVHCPGFRPATWRSTPEAGKIVRLLGEPMSFCDARQQAKQFNQPWPPIGGVDYWAIVIATDARRGQEGAC